jgi:hypothetical protein
MEAINKIHSERYALGNGPFAQGMQKPELVVFHPVHPHRTERLSHIPLTTRPALVLLTHGSRWVTSTPRDTLSKWPLAQAGSGPELIGNHRLQPPSDEKITRRSRLFPNHCLHAFAKPLHWWWIQHDPPAQTHTILGFVRLSTKSN